MMLFKTTFGVPCEKDWCESETTYYLNVGGYCNYLCEKHMIELIRKIEEQFNIIKNNKQ